MILMSQSIISEETYLLDNENPALKETVPQKKKKNLRKYYDCCSMKSLTLIN